VSPPGRWKRIYFMTPTFFPAGGVVKLFDYVNHAISLGYEPVIACPERYKPGLLLFENERFSGISPENGVRFIRLEQVSVGPYDLAFLSWPTHYPLLEPRISRWSRHEQVIQIVQNVRWANPTFERGHAVRSLSRPMARILTNDVVLQACQPYLNPSSMTEVIDLGHNAEFFSKNRTGSLGSPTKVGYTTWKSDVGDRVVAKLSGSEEFEFRAVREPVGWSELRELYHWADVFLATPMAEEGFYLPGLEAMAAGAIVVTSDAGGNLAYCSFGDNCVEADFDNADSYAKALTDLRAITVSEIERFRRAGYETVGRHTLDRERRQFSDFMERLVQRLDRMDPRATSLSNGDS